MEILSFLIVAIVSYTIGYYSKNNKQKKLVATVPVKGTEQELKEEAKLRKYFIDNEIKEETNTLKKLKAEVQEFKNNDYKFFETARHTQWKKEKLEKREIVQAEKAERKAEAKSGSGALSNKPDFMK